jgi:hypothetical protein
MNRRLRHFAIGPSPHRKRPPRVFDESQAYRRFRQFWRYDLRSAAFTASDLKRELTPPELAQAGEAAEPVPASVWRWCLSVAGARCVHRTVLLGRS